MTISKMPRKVVVDTSCLIALTRINELDLLQKVYHRVSITHIIRQEFKLDLPGWVDIVEYSDSSHMKTIQTLVDPGEASAILYCLQHKDCLLVIDDSKGRKLAKRLGLRVSGTLGLISKAKQKGIIQTVRPYLDALEKAEFRFDQRLKELILKSAGEK